MKIHWFEWYCQQLSKHKPWKSYKNRYLCPCCYMPTLTERAGYSICKICFWEDDGQDSDDADIIRGAPNADYSLQEARDNFKIYLTMYRIDDKKAFINQENTKHKRKRLYLYFKKAIISKNQEYWDRALEFEQQNF